MSALNDDLDGAPEQGTEVVISEDLIGTGLRGFVEEERIGTVAHDTAQPGERAGDGAHEGSGIGATISRTQGGKDQAESGEGKLAEGRRGTHAGEGRKVEPAEGLPQAQL